MKTLSDERLSLTTRPFFWKGHNRLSVSVLGAFRFDGDGTAASYLPDSELWATAAPLLDAGIPLEEGFAKPGREFFVAGSAFAPSGGKAEAVKVETGVGDLHRDILVAGDRTWRRGGMGDPEPFASMPVDWAHAYGGAEVTDNPLGKGAAANAKAGPPPIPNVLDTKNLPRSPDAPGAPVSLLPLGPDWAARSQMQVSSDQEWLTTGKPDLPDDFNWSWFFTSSNPAQRGDGSFSPGEKFFVSGMHPEKARVEGTLPREMPWARIESLSEDGSVTPLSVPLALDTVYLFPNAETGILVWHGTVKTAAQQAGDVVAVKAGFGDQPEELEEPEDPQVNVEETAKAPPPPPAPPTTPPPPAPDPEPVELRDMADADKAESEDLRADAPKAENADEAIATASPDDDDLVALTEEFVKEFSDYEPFLVGGELLEEVNKELAELNLPPISEAEYSKGYRNWLASLPDAARAYTRMKSEEAARMPQSEKDATDLLAFYLEELGTDPAQARSIAENLEQPLNLDENTTAEEFFLRELGIDITEVEETIRQVEQTQKEMQASVDEAMITMFGSPLEQLLSPDDDTISLDADDEDSLIDRFFPEPGVNQFVREELAKAKALQAAEQEADDVTSLMDESSAMVEPSSDMSEIQVEAEIEAKEEIEAKAEIKDEDKDTLDPLPKLSPYKSEYEDKYEEREKEREKEKEQNESIQQPPGDDLDGGQGSTFDGDIFGEAQK